MCWENKKLLNRHGAFFRKFGEQAFDAKQNRGFLWSKMQIHENSKNLIYMADHFEL